MMECVRCKVQVGHGRICKRCGAILVESKEPDLTALTETERETPVETPVETPLPPGGWRCPGCSEAIDADFEACWQCGAERPEVEQESAVQSPPPPVLDAATARACARCGSAKVIPDATVEDQGQYSSGDLRVVVHARPDALIFKDGLRGGLRADICGDCGHVEWRVANPDQLYDHYLRSLQSPDHGVSGPS